jgi:iron(III) transport system permease protein
LFELPPIELRQVLPLIWRSLALACCVSLFALFIGTWLAFVDQRRQFTGRKLCSLLAILPLATPSYLIATIVREEMAPAGRIGALLGRESPFTGFWPSVLVLTVACTPFVQVLVSAALQRCPVSEEEAARSLGARPLRIMRTIILPRLRPTWSFALVLVGLYVISDFGAVAILDCEVLTWELYKSRGSRDAVLLGFGLIAVVIPLLVFIRLLHGEAWPEATSLQGLHQRRPLRGIPWVLTWAMMALIIGLGVLLPVISLVDWLQAGLSNPDIRFAPILESSWDTLVYTVIGALFVLLLAFAPAWISARRGGRTGAWVENAVYLTSSLPGILIAVGMLQLIVGLKHRFADIRLWEGLEAGGVVLLLGYGMRFLSQAYAALKPAMLRIEPGQEESARLLGASSWRRFRTIALPTIRPGIFAAYTLLFLSIAKELPITLTLLPLGHTPLSYRIFSAQNEAALHNVGLSGIVLLSFAIIMQLGISRWSENAERIHHRA